jgi:excisionase family DNA binding protein
MPDAQTRIANALERIADALESHGSSDDLLSVAEVAAMLGISDDKVREHRRDGRLRGYNLNKGSSRPHILIKRASVYEFLETLVETPPTRKQKSSKRFDPGDWAD